MDLLIESINKEVILAKSEEDLIKSKFTVKKLRKKQFLMQGVPSFSALYFVEKGLIRAYLSDKNDQEHIMQFAPERHWVGDVFSPLPPSYAATFSIDALESSTILSIEMDDLHQLILDVPKLESYFRSEMTKRLHALHMRVINYLTHFAEDKYRMFLEVYPDLVQRVPQHMIASYLGIKPETLSRNRKKIARGGK